MKLTSSEEALRHFLATFKNLADLVCLNDLLFPSDKCFIQERCLLTALAINRSNIFMYTLYNSPL